MENTHFDRKYKKICYDDRLKLIDLVCRQNYTCASAAKLMNYSPSTVKMIIKKFKEQGKIF
jgi:transposase